MSESRLHYTVYFESRAQAAAWAAEAEATAQLSSPEQARVLGAMLGLGEDSGVSLSLWGRHSCVQSWPCWGRGTCCLPKNGHPV